MRRIQDSLHKRESGGHNVEIRDHSACLLRPPRGWARGERSSVKNHLAARVYGLLILTWRSRTPWTGLTCWIRDCGVCVGKGTISGPPAEISLMAAAPSLLERPVVVRHTWLSASRDFCVTLASKLTQKRLTHVYSQSGGPAHRRGSSPFSFQSKEVIR